MLCNPDSTALELVSPPISRLGHRVKPFAASALPTLETELWLTDGKGLLRHPNK